MRYYLAQDTLIVRGAFRACSTGELGGIRDVTSLLTHQIKTLNHSEYSKSIQNAAFRNGLAPDTTFGLVISAQSTHHAVFRYDQVTVFIIAGAFSEVGSSQDREIENLSSRDSTIRIICTINAHLNDQDLLTSLLAAADAVGVASSSAVKFSGWDRRGIIIGSEKTGPITNENQEKIEEKIFQTVQYAVGYIREHLSSNQKSSRERLAFNIHTTIGGDRWIEWDKKGCPYYPCHFKGQRCDFCYCPLYPCEDETLGEWTTGSRTSGRVWSCAPCTLNHQPSVVHHLRRNPEATGFELKSLLVHYPAK